MPIILLWKSLSLPGQLVLVSRLGLEFSFIAIQSNHVSPEPLVPCVLFRQEIKKKTIILCMLNSGCTRPHKAGADPGF